MEDEENFLREAERKAKQSFLREEIVEAGYSPELFVDYCEAQRGSDVDLWSFDELHQCVADFKRKYTPEDKPSKEGNGEEAKTPARVNKPKEGQPTSPSESQPLPLNDFSSKQDQVYTVKGSIAEQTEISGRDIEIFVSEPEVVPGGLFSSPSIVFYVITTPLGWSVKRKFADFTWLRQTLAYLHPDCFIPPVPERQSKGRITERTLAHQQKFLQRVISAMSRSPILRKSDILVRFLNEEDQTKFNDFKKAVSRRQPPTLLSGFLSEDGFLRLDSQREDAYVRNLGYYLEHTENLKAQLRTQSKALIEALKVVGVTLTAMSETCQKLEEKQSVLPNLGCNSALYSSISLSLHNWAASEFEQALMVDEYFSQNLRYSTAEVKPLKDLLCKRNDALNNFHKAEARLNPKKDKLWYAGDLVKWELSPEDRKLDPSILYSDKALAYSKMLPAETALVSQLNDRFAYFNARVKVESERVLRENAFIDNSFFAEFTKKEAAHCTQLHVQWAQTLAQLAEASHYALEGMS